MLKFTLQITNWYRQNKRDLPWRHTKDPYLIWLSEIILQQTRVEQGLPYYNKFSSIYPTVEHLAQANEEEVLLIWQGLGYYSRARNMLTTAQFILSDHSGNFPHSYQGLLKLKGIGPYTAAAIASFAFDEETPVIDGNVFRVLSRYYGVDSAIDSREGKQQITELANLSIDKKNPALYNQSIMEFGALQCKPKNPNCEICPLNDSCLSYFQNKVQDRPLKIKKIKVTKRYFHYLVSKENEYLTLEKRTANDIWKGLYQFPLIELESTELTDDLITNFRISDSSSIYNHKLTHQTIFAIFHESSNPPNNSLNQSKVAITDLENFAFPRLIQRYLENKEFI